MLIVLASESPRRAELLKAAGFEVEIMSSGVVEQLNEGERAEEYVQAQPAVHPGWANNTDFVRDMPKS